MKVRSRAGAAVCAVLTACGTAQGLTEGAGGDLLFVATTAGVSAVSAETGRVARAIPGGVAAPDLDSVVATRFDGDTTEVTRSTLEGDVVSQTSIDGDVVARLVTGEEVALTDRAGAGETAYLPAPKPRTRVVVLSGDGSQREYDLEGNFEPEAFRVNGREIFMIEYIPAMAPERYRVRRLRLRDGAVRPIGRLKFAAPGQMQGTGRTQVLAPSGDELYTLYTQQPEAGHRATDSAGGDAFVHLLNLRQAWAHCIDLPSVFASGSASASAIAVEPSGTRLFVADWSNDAVAVVSPNKLRVIASGDVAFGTEDASTAADASWERLYVGGNDTIVVVDTATLEVVDRWAVGAEVNDVTLTDEILYVTTSEAVIEMDAATGRELGRVPVEGGTALQGVVDALR